jgi:hypothetical protein
MEQKTQETLAEQPNKKPPAPRTALAAFVMLHAL